MNPTKTNYKDPLSTPKKVDTLEGNNPLLKMSNALVSNEERKLAGIRVLLLDIIISLQAKSLSIRRMRVVLDKG